MTGVRGHDPICPIARETWCLWSGDKCEKCALIRRARADERQQILALLRGALNDNSHTNAHGCIALIEAR